MQSQKAKGTRVADERVMLLNASAGLASIATPPRKHVHSETLVRAARKNVRLQRKRSSTWEQMRYIFQLRCAAVHTRNHFAPNPQVQLASTHLQRPSRPNSNHNRRAGKDRLNPSPGFVPHTWTPSFCTPKSLPAFPSVESRTHKLHVRSSKQPVAETCPSILRHIKADGSEAEVLRIQFRVSMKPALEDTGV